MIQQAIDNLRQAAAEGKAGSVTEYISRRLIEQAVKTEEDAAKILAEGKNLSDCYKGIRKKAKEQAEDGCACVDDGTVYGWALEYYGLGEADISHQEQTVATASAAGELHVDLLDLL